MAIAIAAGGNGDIPDISLVFMSADGEERAVEHLEPIDAFELSQKLAEAACTLQSFRDMVQEI